MSLPAPRSRLPTRRQAGRSGRGNGKRTVKPPRDGVAVTHPDKVMFPDAGITKGEVFEFYRRIAPRLLPYLRDRPVTLERLPDGLGGSDRPHFWQKDIPSSYPEWIPRIDAAHRAREVGPLRPGQ